MRKIALIGALALTVVPGAFASHPPALRHQANAVRDCRALRAELGVATFRETYGTARARRANAFGRCVRTWAREERLNWRQAVEACRAERQALGAQEFREKYGAGEKNVRAFARCVRVTRRAESADDRARTVNAARTCKDEREEVGVAAFRAKYGKNENDRNAFGKCVSALAKGEDDD
jgi:hypothetical protein